MDSMFNIPTQPPPVQPALMLQRHMTFEQWFLMIFRQGSLPVTAFTVPQMETEYKLLCWKEEALWKAWCDNVKR